MLPMGHIYYYVVSKAGILEETLEVIDLTYAFGIFIEGEGVEPDKNWALASGSNVSVAHVNPNENPSLYRPNDDPSKAMYQVWQYDGFTKKIQAKVPVTSGKSYKIKLLIFDRKDGIYDSGVFVDMRSE